MQPGLMQNAPLLISSIVTHAARAHGDREIVSRLVDEPLWRYDYAGLAARSAQAASMLGKLGIGPGDCVSSLAWNTHRHYELFFAVPGIVLFWWMSRTGLIDSAMGTAGGGEDGNAETPH